MSDLPDPLAESVRDPELQELMLEDFELSVTVGFATAAFKSLRDREEQAEDDTLPHLVARELRKEFERHIECEDVEVTIELAGGHWTNVYGGLWTYKHETKWSADSDHAEEACMELKEKLPERLVEFVELQEQGIDQIQEHLDAAGEDR